MAIYTFQCKQCGEIFDILVNVTADKERKQCPKCSSQDIKKTFHSFSVGSSRSSLTESTCSQCPTFSQCSERKSCCM